MNEVDFSSCRRIPGRAYNGANGKKIAVEWRGNCWILKFPPSAADGGNFRIQHAPCQLTAIFLPFAPL